MGNEKVNLNSIQFARAFAVVSVLLFHATGLLQAYNHSDLLWGIFNKGYFGVDLFFVISGFIIYYIHQADIGNREKFKEYIYKRFIRIVPICWIVLFFLVIIYFAIPSFGSEGIRDPLTLVKSFLFIPQNDHILIVTWSLTHEIIFYTIFGLLIFSRKMKPIVVIWVALTLLFMFFNKIFGNLYLQTILSQYNIEFIFGCIAAHIISRKKTKYERLILILAVIALALVYVSVDQEQDPLSRLYLFGLPFSFVIYGIVALEINKGFRSFKLFALLGNASYSIYLTHYPLLSIINKASHFSRINAGVFIYLNIFLTLFIGCIFHLYIEKPLLTRLRLLRLSREDIPISNISKYKGVSE